MRAETRQPDPPRTVPARGAYGLRVDGLAGAEEWMQPQSAEAPPLRVSVHTGNSDDSPSTLSEHEADIRLLGGGRLRARRGEGAIDYHLQQRPSPAELLHPYLAPGAALHWQWDGHEALHAGAVQIADRSVLVFGPKAAGKSTTLAWLARQLGLGILSDDLAVIVDGAVLAGPRSIDLRGAGEASGAGDGDADTRVRQGERLRRSLPAVAPAAEIGGTVLLDWGDRLEVESISPAERLGVLAAQRTFPTLAEDPNSLLDVASKPMFRLSRPPDIALLDASARALVDCFS